MCVGGSPWKRLLLWQWCNGTDGCPGQLVLPGRLPGARPALAAAAATLFAFYFFFFFFPLRLLPLLHGGYRFPTRLRTACSHRPHRSHNPHPAQVSLNISDVFSGMCSLAECVQKLNQRQAAATRPPSPSPSPSPSSHPSVTVTATPTPSTSPASGELIRPSVFVHSASRCKCMLGTDAVSGPDGNQVSSCSKEGVGSMGSSDGLLVCDAITGLLGTDAVPGPDGNQVSSCLCKFWGVWG